MVKISQDEVYKWLKDRRIECSRYYTIEEIRLGINPKLKQSIIYDDVLQLNQFGYLDSRLREVSFNDFTRVFRLKKLYLEKVDLDIL